VSAFSPSQAIVAAMITPALLILASGSLIATTLVRLARVVDRIRKLSELPAQVWTTAELDRQERRALLAERALAAYFTAVACFVIAGFAIALDHGPIAALKLPVIITIVGMVLIVAGSALMVAETRLSVTQLRSEIRRLRDGAGGDATHEGAATPG
jgi:hypothetical protein